MLATQDAILDAPWIVFFDASRCGAETAAQELNKVLGSDLCVLALDVGTLASLKVASMAKAGRGLGRARPVSRATARAQAG